MRKALLAFMLVFVVVTAAVLVVSFTGQDSRPAHASEQQVVVASAAIPGVSIGIDPGGGVISISGMQHTTPVTLAGVTYGPNFGWESAHLTEPIGVQSGSQRPDGVSTLNTTNPGQKMVTITVAQHHSVGATSSQGNAIKAMYFNTKASGGQVAIPAQLALGRDSCRGYN